MLTIDWTSEEPASGPLQLLAVAVAGDGATAVEKRFGPAVARAAAAARFLGRSGDKFSFTRERGGELQSVVLLGVGTDPAMAGGLRKLGHDAARAGTSVGAQHLVLDLRGVAITDKLDVDHTANLVAQGLELGTYRFDRYIAEDKRRSATVQRVSVVRGELGDGAARGQTIATCVARARDLVNGPANVVTPTYLAKFAGEVVAELKGKADVELVVLEREDCEKRGMGCYLAVAAGSDEPPKFIHLKYTPKETSKGRVCIIGKGVTFDSGGLSIKPSDAMMGMKMDMGGAAAVLCAFEAAARLGVPWELHAIVPATENMINGKAYKLGDVLTASNGKTVEIDNTDAEGRLTLADALIYASKLSPTYTLDFATLTGACIIALGPHIAGVMSPDDELTGK